jgi:CheY-like chemotaxis protein
LGLASAYAAVKQHRGAIAVESRAGEGTSFWVTLPLLPGEPPARMASKPSPAGKGRILLVDDEPMIRRMVQSILVGLGYEIVLASNGREAVETFEREQGRFDVVLLDLVMPEMDGPDCFRALQRLAPRVRVLMSSGFTQDADMQALFKEGVRGFLSKPYLTADLSKALEEILASPD